MQVRHVAEQIVLDFAICAAGGGVIAGIAFGGGKGVSFAAGCLWLGLNFAALAWLLSSVAGPLKASRWFIFTVACAKIPLSYAILFWLYRQEYLDAVGLTAGLAMLPAVLLFRGLMLGRDGRSVLTPPETLEQGDK